MAFTAPTITHRFENADGTAASGSIEFTLTKRMSQAGITIVPASITANLDASGNLSQALTANTDLATVPADAQWRVDFKILGAQHETFTITVPSGLGPVDLFTLLPNAPLGG